MSLTRLETALMAYENTFNKLNTFPGSPPHSFALEAALDAADAWCSAKFGSINDDGSINTPHGPFTNGEILIDPKYVSVAINKGWIISGWRNGLIAVRRGIGTSATNKSQTDIFGEPRAISRAFAAAFMDELDTTANMGSIAAMIVKDWPILGRIIGNALEKVLSENRDGIRRTEI
jgi:hypothetical protein